MVLTLVSLLMMEFFKAEKYSQSPVPRIPRVKIVSYGLDRTVLSVQNLVKFAAFVVKFQSPKGGFAAFHSFGVDLAIGS